MIGRIHNTLKSVHTIVSEMPRSIVGGTGMDKFARGWNGSKIRQNSLIMLLLLAGAVFLFLKFLEPLLSPVLAAMLFVTIFGPLLQKMQKLHLHRQVGAVLVLLLALAIFGLLLWALCHFLWSEYPSFLSQAEKWKEQLPGWADGWVELALSELRKSAATLERGMLGGALHYAGKAAAIGGYLITFLIAVVLLAKDYDEFMNRLLAREDCHVLLSVICGVIRYLATYVKAQGVIMTVIAGLCALSLSLLGVARGALWGLLAGVLDALPFIGTGVVLVPLALLHLLEGKTGTAIAIACLYLACILLREMLEPKLIGKRMGIRPIFVLLSLYAGIRLFGLAGIIKGPLGFIILWTAHHHLHPHNDKK